MRRIDFGGGAEKVGAALEFLGAAGRKPQPCFVNERGGLQGLARGLLSHFGGGHAAQVLVNERKQLVGGGGVAVLYCLKNARYVTHGVRMSKLEAKRQPVERGRGRRIIV